MDIPVSTEELIYRFGYSKLETDLFKEKCIALEMEINQLKKQIEELKKE